MPLVIDCSDHFSSDALSTPPPLPVLPHWIFFTFWTPSMCCLIWVPLLQNWLVTILPSLTLGPSLRGLQWEFIPEGQEETGINVPLGGLLWGRNICHLDWDTKTPSPENSLALLLLGSTVGQFLLSLHWLCDSRDHRRWQSESVSASRLKRLASSTCCLLEHTLWEPWPAIERIWQL